jgi:hypothetical protein
MERNDAEIAHTLSAEINRNRASTPRSAPTTTTKPFQIIPWERNPRPLGKLVAQASCSQFAITGGQLACTSICLYAAAQLLSRINEAPQCITTPVLDGYLEVGSALYQNVALLQGDYYTSVDDLWNQTAFQNIVQSF